MCAEYELRKNKNSIQEALQLELGGQISGQTGGQTGGQIDRKIDENPGDDFPYRRRIRLFQDAPIVKSVDDSMQMVQMSFSLKPASLKYATFNARLLDFDERQNKVTRIFDKPTWKEPFTKGRCLIPMDGFIEPIYHGAHAGEMVEFHDHRERLLLAAGLCAVSRDPKTGTDYAGFSIIMHTPDEKVQSEGHHRTPVFLENSSCEDWLLGDMSPEERFDFLLKKRQELELLVRTDRKMARGWEKRVPTIEAKFEKEKNTEKMIDTWLERGRS